jgi:formiminotetrahydrofolate cyclodeaminase
VEVRGSEIVGLVPRRALEDAAVHYLKIENYRPDLIVENRLAKVLSDSPEKTAPLSQLAEGFVARVASDSPTPGGGSVAALAVALGAALGEMVCRISLKRKSLADHFPALNAAVARLDALREEALRAVDRDAQSFDAVMAAMKLPKGTAAEEARRRRAVEDATKAAALVPLSTAEQACATKAALESLRGITAPQAASDLTVGWLVAEAGRQSAMENVRINLESLEDRAWAEEVERKLQRLEEGSPGLELKLKRDG